MPIAKTVIRILVGWGRMPVQEFYVFALTIYHVMTDNAASFPNPPVDLKTFKTVLDRFQSSIAEATYSDSRAILARDTLRTEVHVMLRQLAHYVEHLCALETDRASQDYLVAHSGFQTMKSTTSPDEILVTSILRILNPRTGVLVVRYKPAGRKARKYDVRMAAQGTSDPDTWPIRSFANAKDGATYEGLTPGVIYTFQVRVYANLGYGDWSQPVSKMCT